MLNKYHWQNYPNVRTYEWHPDVGLEVIIAWNVTNQEWRFRKNKGK